MINKIIIKGPASYKSQAMFETNKNINLIYGLNGSGKSTLSEFLRQRQSPQYTECKIEPEMNDDEEEILVYNEHYVNDVFYQNDSQKGIFSLSKENAEARRKIDDATVILNDARIKQNEIVAQKNNLQKTWNTSKNTFADRLWSIKTQYSGGDRVLEYCLDGLKGSKDTLLNYIVKIKKEENAPSFSIDDLKNDIQELNKAKGTQIPSIPELSFLADEIESNQLFSEIITGNPNSRVAKLIDSLHNSDWVKQGLSYEANGVCPFCQRPYLDDTIIEELKDYFNDNYEKAIASISILKDKYKELMDNLPSYDFFDKYSILEKYKTSFTQQMSALKDAVGNNYCLILSKIEKPSETIVLQKTEQLVSSINSIIIQANETIKYFNDRLIAIDREYSSIKEKFWLRMRYDYDQTIQDYNQQKETIDKKIRSFDSKIEQLSNSISTQNGIIEQEQKNVVNIESSIININSMLVDMGITDFRISKYQEEGLYRIIRDELNEPVFKTLSEGERTIISVLYFIETCKGLLDKSQVQKKRIIVIDDPVSSLSNVYIFNIGRLIRDVFYPSLIKKSEEDEDSYDLKTKFEQVFILTHSLYFLYEMTEMDKDKRHASQALYRILKTGSGSKIDEMHYEHIQTEYHTYWLTIKDQDTNPALIANCMRNIVEYFFNFVEKRDLNNVFNQEKFKHNKYQAFVRYINRESHSLGQNIYDFKDFDYDVFMDALKMLFKESGYEEHYKKMMKLK